MPKTSSRSLFAAPIEPMLAKSIEALPEAGDFLLRAEVGRLSRHRLSSDGRRDLDPEPRPASRSTATFPSCARPCSSDCRPAAIVDGEIVVVRGAGLDFDSLQQRLHPAASRVARLAVETPASFVAFDLLAARRPRA